MAAAGLKYLVLPANQDLGPILLRGNPHLNEKTPFWWEGPMGNDPDLVFCGIATRC